MLYIQIVFSMILSCILGIANASALAVVIIGAIIPGIDASDRSYSRCFSVKGFTHSILFVVLLFLLAFKSPVFLYLAIGVAGHILVELLSKDAKIQLLFPLPTRVNIPLFHQYKKMMIFIGVVLTCILFICFIDVSTCFDILKTYWNWILSMANCVKEFLASIVIRS